MVVFPLIALLISAACAAVIGYDAWRRPKPDRIVWTIAFGIFAIAAGAEVAGSLAEWSEPLVRLYYLTGAVLVVGYLALGEAYLLARNRVAKWAPGLTILVTALAATLVIDAPIDTAAMAEDGWHALERGPALIALTVSINVLGSIVLIAGALYSARTFRKLGVQRERMIGCVLIALGTFAVASGGTLTRFGQSEYLYIAMSLGVAIIFAGVLKTRRPHMSTAPMASMSSASSAAKPRLVPLPDRQTGDLTPAARDQGIAYIESQLLPLDASAISDQCSIWSVAAREMDAFDRRQARQVWRLRSCLSADNQRIFDQLPIAVRWQLAELYGEVFSAADDVARSGRNPSPRAV